MNANPMLTILENLRKTISKLETKICEISKSKNSTGGTCASILLLCENSYYIAHVGDSRIILLTNKDSNYEHQQLTTDHKPEDRNEKIRI